MTKELGRVQGKEGTLPHHPHPKKEELNKNPNPLGHLNIKM